MRLPIFPFIFSVRAKTRDMSVSIPNTIIFIYCKNVPVIVFRGDIYFVNN